MQVVWLSDKRASNSLSLQSATGFLDWGGFNVMHRGSKSHERECRKIVHTTVTKERGMLHCESV